MFGGKLAARVLTGAIVGGLLAITPALAQDGAPRPAVSAYPKPTAFPNANEAAVTEHFNRARAIAGDDLQVFFNTLCIDQQGYGELIRGAQYHGIIPAQRLFDNLYYVGQMMVSAWAIKTRDGIILIDALNNADEAREIMVPGLVKLGLNPKDIKYVIITHSHGDHYGGAQYFKDTYGAKLLASSADWDAMGKPSPMSGFKLFDAAPKHGTDDITVVDGQVLSLGGEDVHFALTPAHTAGTLSLYFKVLDNGTPHVVGMYGGIGLPRTVELKQMQIRSMTHWMDVTKAAGVDAVIGNHPLHFDGPPKFEILKYREPGQRNPFVLGDKNYQRFVDLQRECVKLSLARDGITQ
jgi:metallo-beta-lactamase class B